MLQANLSLSYKRSVLFELFLCSILQGEFVFLKFYKSFLYHKDKGVLSRLIIASSFFNSLKLLMIEKEKQKCLNSIY